MFQVGQSGCILPIPFHSIEDISVTSKHVEHEEEASFIHTIQFKTLKH